MRLERKNIIITGASSGIGRACAIHCNKLGANIHLIARNRARLDEVASHLKSDTFSINEYDVSVSEGIEELVKAIVGEFGKIDGFIHSAGFQKIQPFRTQNQKHFLDVFSVNTFAAFEFSRIITKKKYSNSDGMSIVFISSVMSVAADAGLTSYCASKAALVGGARSMAIELSNRSIRVNCVSPGTVEDTGITDQLIDSLSSEEIQKIKDMYPGGLGKSKDVAQLCAFLLSEDAKWITGQNIVIDGGYSVL